jgi:hypothetical protein
VQRTVFILGAGASRHLGFPLGGELKSQIVDGLRSSGPGGSVLGNELKAIGFDDILIAAFTGDLAASVKPSVDAFLQLEHNKTRYNDIGRAAMAAHLLPIEERLAYEHHSRTDCWYRYVINEVVPDALSADGTPTNLRIVTLNFDRSVEASIEYHMHRTFGVPADEAQAVARRMIPVVHVHGALAGRYSWITPHLRDDRAETVRASQKSIRVVGDDLDEKALQTAHGWLDWSQRICLLGFGFHPFVEGRLEIAARALRKKVYATTMGIHPGPMGRIAERYAAIGPEYFPKTIDQFLCDSNVLFSDN